MSANGRRDSKGAPAAARALGILDFLAAHPTESFTLSELARELEIGSGSAHALLRSMERAGYLIRHPSHKTYRLGPSTIAVGHAALESHPVIAIARDEMQRVANEFDLECLATAPLGDESVVVARAGRPRTPLTRVGERRLLAPPLGTMYVAWSGTEAIEAWLGRADPTDSADQLRRYRQVLDSERALGYSIGVRLDDAIITAAPVGNDPTDLDLDPDTAYEVIYIAAPVFDERSEVALVLNLDGFREPLLPDEIRKLAHRFLDSANIISRGVHGRIPEGLS